MLRAASQDPRPGGRASRPPRPVAGTAAVLAALGILAATLAPGDPRVLQPTPLTCLVCGSLGAVDVVFNFLLFAPFGAAVGWLTGRWRRALLAGLALSLTVEAAQLLLVTARDASLSDLVFNTAGATTGGLLLLHWRRWLLPAPAAAARLAAAAALGWAAVLVATARGLDLLLPAPPYVVNVISRDAVGTVRPYEGTVLRSEVLGVEAPAPGWPGAPRTIGAAAPPSLPLVVEADVHAMLPPGMLRPLGSLHAADSTSLVVLGQRGRHLMLRARTRSAAARFQTPTVSLDHAFPSAAEIPPGTDPGRGPVVRLRGEVTRRELRLSATWGGRTRDAAMPRSPLVGWTFFAVYGLRYGRFGPLLTAVWIAALLLPGAYWATRARPPAERAARPGGLGRAALLYGAAVLGVMAAVPALFALHPPLPRDWVAAAAALLAGSALAAVGVTSRRGGTAPRGRSWRG
jgi:hypothetical protein